MPDITKKKEITNFRELINGVDNKMVKLFEERLLLAKEIVDYKKAHNLAIQDTDRESEVVENATAAVDDDMRAEVTLLMRSIISLSREYQRSLSFASAEPDFLPPPVPHKTESVRICYQGVPGAWGELAARKLFPETGAEITNADYFESVFRKVKDGAADYGVLPIENSKTGAIGETYDLLRRLGCYIVGRTWIDVKHCLLAKPGAALKDIREIYSHPQGFQQCRHFLEDKPWDQIASSNTAVAASKASKADGLRAAAIGSAQAAEHNGLVVLAPNIMDSDTNRTSFVVIAAQPEYDAASDLISISFTAAHRSGSLCEALLPFMASDVNLTRIESRPSSSASSYRFFAEISGNIGDPIVKETLTHAAAATDYLEVIGCYKQV
ncbi:MAG: chorismate mutase [Clostridiales Family XIII bacterium]|jgi:chorismate mutase/prephenate dehydratase|nr:chorismate mutase [Clostridiales Family XIII bacterium]